MCLEYARVRLTSRVHTERNIDIIGRACGKNIWFFLICSKLPRQFRPNTASIFVAIFFISLFGSFMNDIFRKYVPFLFFNILLRAWSRVRHFGSFWSFESTTTTTQTTYLPIYIYISHSFHFWSYVAKGLFHLLQFILLVQEFPAYEVIRHSSWTGVCVCVRSCAGPLYQFRVLFHHFEATKKEPTVSRSIPWFGFSYAKTTKRSLRKYSRTEYDLFVCGRARAFLLNPLAKHNSIRWDDLFCGTENSCTFQLKFNQQWTEWRIMASGKNIYKKFIIRPHANCIKPLLLFYFIFRKFRNVPCGCRINSINENNTNENRQIILCHYRWIVQIVTAFWNLVKWK